MELTEERIKELLEVERFMKALEEAGVDEWEGFGEALGIFAESND